MVNLGILYGIAAYVAWGLFPLYWKQLEAVPAGQVIGHRIVWSFATLAAILAVTHQWRSLRSEAARPRVVRLHALAAALITVNWFTYVWGVTHGFIVETSLGYFINPLVNVVLGVVVFRERLRSLQWIAVALAACGVAYLTLAYGAVPWIALVLAFSFGGYGAVKKRARLASMHGLTIETGLLLVPALLYLLYADRAGRGAFLHDGAAVDALLAGAGAVTTVPLLLFASALPTTPLSTMGILQYVSPTLQLMIGVVVYGEPFTRTQFGGFAIVWTGLMVFGGDRFLQRGAGTPEGAAVLEDL